MLLKDCKFGEIIYLQYAPKNGDLKLSDNNPVQEFDMLTMTNAPKGHIKGLDKNDFNETIIVVSWDDGTVSSVHPELITTVF